MFAMNLFFVSYPVTLSCFLRIFENEQYVIIAKVSSSRRSLYSLYIDFAIRPHFSLTIIEFGFLIISIPSRTRSSRIVNSSVALSKKWDAFLNSEWSNLKNALSPGDFPIDSASWGWCCGEAAAKGTAPVLLVVSSCFVFSPVLSIFSWDGLVLESVFGTSEGNSFINFYFVEDNGRYKRESKMWDGLSRNDMVITKCRIIVETVYGKGYNKKKRIRHESS